MNSDVRHDILLLTGQCGRGKVAIDGRPHEVDGVFDSRLDKDDDVFQEVKQIEEDRPPTRRFEQRACTTHSGIILVVSAAIINS